MAKGLDWLLSFQDKISGPALDILEAVAELDAKLFGMPSTFAKVDSAVDKTAGKFKSFGAEFDALQKTLSGSGSGKVGGLFAAFEREQAALKAAGGVDATEAIDAQRKAFTKLRAEAKAANDNFARSFKAPSTPLDMTAGGSRGGPESLFAKLIQSVGASSPGAAQGLLNAGRGLADVDDKLQAIGLSLPGVAAGFAAAGAAAAAFVAIGATAIVLKGSSMVIDAVAFKENSLAAFKILTKTDAAAQEAYSTALATADLLGANRRETLTSFQQLLTKRFDLSTVTSITKAMADLQAINPNANIQSLILAIGQIQDKKKLQGEELMQLAEGGLSRGGVMEALVQATGKSLDEVDKMLKAGKVDAKMGVDAILASIETLTGGELGDAAIQKASSISGLLKQLSWENLQDRLFLDVDIGPGFDAFKGFLLNLNNLLNANSEAGNRLRSVIGSSFGGLFAAVFGDLSGAEGAKTLEATILKIVGLIESVLAGVTGFFSGFGSALADWLGLGAKSFQEMTAPERAAMLEKITGDFRMLGTALGELLVFGVAVVGMFVGLGEAVSLVTQMIFDPINLILGWLDGLVPGFHAKGTSLGQAIANGMTFGIYGAISQLFGAGAAMGQATEDGLRTKTKTHSPSELFDEIAGDLVDGFTGRMANDNGPEMAAAAMIGSPAELAQDARQSGARMAGGARGADGSRTYYITVNAPSGRAEDIRDSLADLLDELEASAA